MKNLLCLVGFHKWKQTKEFKYIDDEAKRLGITCQDAERVCVRCKRKQKCEIHCLGLKPPKYIHIWFEIK